MQLVVELLLVPEDAVSTGDKKFNLPRCHLLPYDILWAAPHGL